MATSHSERPPGSHPGYAGLRETRLPADIKAEFGVERAGELIDRANRIREQRGQRPLAVGSFPTNRGNLARLVRLLRDELRQMP